MAGATSRVTTAAPTGRPATGATGSTRCSSGTRSGGSLVRLYEKTVTPPDSATIEVHICFFFQAEDGIRDWSVTGVQTCALPILPALKKLVHAAISDEKSPLHGRKEEEVTA